MFGIPLVLFKCITVEALCLNFKVLTVQLQCPNSGTLGHDCKVPKFSDSGNFNVLIKLKFKPKIQTERLNHRIIC